MPRKAKHVSPRWQEPQFNYDLWVLLFVLVCTALVFIVIYAKGV